VGRNGNKGFSVVPGKYSELWHASYSRGRWSRAESVPAMEQFAWDLVSASDVIATPDGGVAIALPVSRYGDGHGGIQLVSWNAGMWHTDILPLSLPVPPAYVNIASIQNGALAIVFIASAPGMASDVSSVFAMVQDLRDGSWPAPSLISRSGLGPAFSPHIFASHDGGAGVLWQQSVSSTSLPNVVQYSRTSDLHTWVPAAALSAPDAQNLHATINRCGWPVVVFESDASGRPPLGVSMFDGARWGSTTTLFPGRISVGPSIAADRRGCIHMVWNSTPRPAANSARFDRPRTTYSRACPARAQRRALR
jgi:hypothetical protein